MLPRAEVLPAAQAYAADLAANCSPTSMALIRRQVFAGLDTGPAEAAADAVRRMAESLAGPDFAAAVTGLMEGRPPRFPPRDAG